MVDSHALVGSCAQIGSRVHLSAAAQIGGVIEPVGAMPVIIEDDVLVGGNTGIYEGAVVKARAVIAAGTVLTGSTPVYDLPNGRDHQARARTAARRSPKAPSSCPARARSPSVPGRTGACRWPRPSSSSIATTAPTPGRSSSVDPVDPVALARHPRRHRVDDWPGRRGRPRARRLPSASAATRCSSSRSIATGASTSSPPSASPRWCSRRTSTACRRSFPAGSTAACCTAAAPAMPRASWPRRWPRPSGCARAGETRVGLVFVAGEERGSDGAKAANTIASRSTLSDQRRAHRQRLGSATRGVYPRTAHRARPGRAFRLSRSWASRPSRSCSTCCATCGAAPGPGPRARHDPLHRRAINGGVAPNVVPPRAEAEIIFRTVGDHDALRAALARAASADGSGRGGPRAAAGAAAHGAGFETDVFAYTTRRAVPRRGARRCCSVRARSTWRIPTASRCRSPNSTAPSTSTPTSRPGS